jgi:hypothetical protein
VCCCGISESKMSVKKLIGFHCLSSWDGPVFIVKGYSMMATWIHDPKNEETA